MPSNRKATESKKARHAVKSGDKDKKMKLFAIMDTFLTLNNT